MKLLRMILGLTKISLGISIGLATVVAFFPELFPLGPPSPATTTITSKTVTDIHVHVAGLGHGDSDCFVAPDLNSSYKKFFYLRAFGVTEKELKQRGDGLVVSRLSALVADSKLVKRAIVLALDGVYDDSGELRRDKTQVYVPNEFVRRETAKFPNLLYGASINPMRKDALEALRKAKADGAVLVKWIPSIMHIDPSDPRFTEFYQELIRLDLPLLTHAGQERSFSTAIDELCDPERLKLPLDLGVRVIAAHVATTGQIDGVEMIDRLLPLFARYPNLYTDISSLTQINKLAYVDQSLLNQSIADRMVYGSDWPLQFFPLVSAWLHLPRLRLADIQYINAQPNALDRDVMLKTALGMKPSVFAQTEQILKLPQ